MRVLGVVSAAVRFLWRYLVTVALMCGLAASMIGVATAGTGPVPQQPPDGYVVSSGNVSLEWNRGTRSGPITLQVAVDDPSFSKPILSRVVGGTSHSLTDVRRGKKYYWRLLRDDGPSPTATFAVPENHVDF